MKRFFGSILVGVLVIPVGLFGGQKIAIRSVKVQSNVQSKGGVKSGVPFEINYQGWLGFASDTSAVTGKYNMTFKIYDSVTGGLELWTEDQDSVQVSRGIFNVLLGSVASIPYNLFDDNVSLYLETKVGSDILVPRKKLTSVGYAIKANRSDNAAYADTAATALSLQGIDTVTLKNKYVFKSGDNMTGRLAISASSASDMISSTQTGTGTAGYFQINNASNTNPGIYVTTNGAGAGVYSFINGTGNPGYFQINNASNPAEAVYAYTIGTGRGGVFEISNASNSNSGIYVATNGTGAALFANASGAGKAGFFQINNVSSTNDVLYSSTTGLGRAGYFNINNALNSTDGIYSLTNGTGRAAHFEINNTSNLSPVIEAYTTGTGKAGRFAINNVLNSSAGVYSTTNGTGAAIYGYTGGTGNAGYFHINNASNVNDVLYTYTIGEGRAGYFEINNASNAANAIYTATNGTGNAFHAYTTGTGRAGYFQINNASNASAGLYAITNGTGRAGYFEVNKTSNSSEALYANTTGIGRAAYFNINNASNASDLVYLNSDGTGNFINASNGAYLSGMGKWTDASSREYKENIEALRADEAMSAVRNLNPVKFNYKRNKEDKCIGFIAEEVPDLVAEEGRKGLSPMDIVAALTKVVQEQQKEIDALKEKVDQLSK